MNTIKVFQDFCFFIYSINAFSSSSLILRAEPVLFTTNLIQSVHILAEPKKDTFFIYEICRFEPTQQSLLMIYCDNGKHLIIQTNYQILSNFHYLHRFAIYTIHHSYEMQFY